MISLQLDECRQAFSAVEHRGRTGDRGAHIAALPGDGSIHMLKTTQAMHNGGVGSACGHCDVLTDPRLKLRASI